MLIRALIVLLLVLNLGVGLWWLMRPAPPPPVGFTPAPGVELLQRLAPADAAAGSPAPAARAAAPRCLAFGPYADIGSAAAARDRLQAHGTAVEVRVESAGTPTRWRVFLPPFPTLEEAEAAARRVVAAGFGDQYVVREGSAARSVALGMYRSERAAGERAAALVGAGFPARVEPLGSGVGRWLDVEVDASFDAGAARAELEAAQVLDRECPPAPAPDTSPLE